MLIITIRTLESKLYNMRAAQIFLSFLNPKNEYPVNGSAQTSNIALLFSFLTISSTPTIGFFLYVLQRIVV